MFQCFKCGTELEDDLIFCTECGSKQLSCPKCHSKTLADYSFCLNCGTSLSPENMEDLDVIEKSEAIKDSEVYPSQEIETPVFRRGGAWVMAKNRLFYEFKVKIENTTTTSMGDVDVYLKYPGTALNLLTKNPLKIPYLLPNRSQSTTFRLEPLDRCVGDFLEATVIYYGGRDGTEKQVMSLDPWEIEYKCNLLVPDPISTEEFDQRTARMKGKQVQLMMPVTLETLRHILTDVVSDCNLATVDHLQEQAEELQRYYAIGKFDREAVAMTVGLSPQQVGTKMTLNALSEDDAKLPHLLNEFAQRIIKEIKIHDQKVETAHEEIYSLLNEFKSEFRNLLELIGQDLRWTVEEIERLHNFVVAIEANNVEHQKQLIEFLEGGSRFDEVNLLMERLEQIETKIAKDSLAVLKYEWRELKQEPSRKGKFKRFMNIFRIGVKEGAKTLVTALLRQIVPVPGI